MLLKKKQVTSNASRLILNYDLKWGWKKLIFPKILTLRNKSLYSGGSNRKKIIRTKGPYLSTLKTPLVNYMLSLKSLSFVSSLRLVSKNTNIFTLLLNSNGSYYYSPVGEIPFLFSFLYFKKKKFISRYFFPKPTFSFLFQLPLLKKISNVEIFFNKGVQYSRSLGVFSKILNKNFYTHTVLIQLPSGVKKIFSFYSLTLINSSYLLFKKKKLNTKSGYWRSLGNKPKVRGVAMNPVDHPHGGRTKAIKYPRTPWGKTTKFK